MNNSRRSDVKTIVKELKEIKEKLGKVLFWEQDAFDNMPEGLQYSRNGEDSEEAINNMEESMDSIQEAIDKLSEIV